MPPRKKVEGITRLVGKPIMAESVYDNVPLRGTLLSYDGSYLEIQAGDGAYFFNKDIVRCLREEVIADAE